MTEPAPPQLLGVRTDQTEVMYSTFLLIDPYADDSPLATAVVGEHRPTVDPGTRPGGATLHSGGNDFLPTVRLESWSGPPPTPDGTWDTLDEVEVEMPSGTAQLSPMDSPPTCKELELGHPGWYRLRACSRGRAAAAARGEGEFFTGVEEWVLQLWLHEAEME